MVRTDEVEARTALDADVCDDTIDLVLGAPKHGVEAARPDLRIRRKFVLHIACPDHVQICIPSIQAQDKTRTNGEKHGLQLLVLALRECKQASRVVKRRSRCLLVRLKRVCRNQQECSAHVDNTSRAREQLRAAAIRDVLIDAPIFARGVCCRYRCEVDISYVPGHTNTLDINLGRRRVACVNATYFKLSAPPNVSSPSTTPSSESSEEAGSYEMPNESSGIAPWAKRMFVMVELG